MRIIIGEEKNQYLTEATQNDGQTVPEKRKKGSLLEFAKALLCCTKRFRFLHELKPGAPYKSH